MSKEKARAHFLGQPGHSKLNCAQTIVNAFKERFALSDAIIDQFKGYGGGMAPEGECGALYAAKVILEKYDPGKLSDCAHILSVHAGSTKCAAIRSSRKLPCIGCVEKMAEYLENL